MGDCNAHAGSVETSGISSHGWELDNFAGEHLRSLIENHDMILPATHSHLHSGPSSTFRSASGGQSRVDYIGVPLSWTAGIRSSVVDCDFDLLSGDFDHFVVALDLEFSVVPSSGVSRPRRALYDRKKARDSPDLLKRMIVTMPYVPWGVGIDSHWEALEKHCATFLKKWFPFCPKDMPGKSSSVTKLGTSSLPARTRKYKSAVPTDASMSGFCVGSLVFGGLPRLNSLLPAFQLR